MTEYVITLRNGLQNLDAPLSTLLAANHLNVVEALPTGRTVVISVSGKLDAQTLKATIGVECYVSVRIRGSTL